MSEKIAGLHSNPFEVVAVFVVVPDMLLILRRISAQVYRLRAVSPVSYIRLPVILCGAFPRPNRFRETSTIEFPFIV